MSLRRGAADDIVIGMRGKVRQIEIMDNPAVFICRLSEELRRRRRRHHHYIAHMFIWPEELTGYKLQQKAQNLVRGPEILKYRVHV